MTNKLPLILGLLFTTACGEKDPEPSAEPAGEPTAEPAGEPAGEPAEEVIDEDGDGVAEADDCDDTNADLGAIADDADCDGVATADDCDDTDADWGLATDEVCDGMDNNCDGEVDEGVLSTFYADGDGDGFGSGAYTEDACEASDGYVDNDNDCDDADAAVGDAPDADGDGYMECMDCNDADAMTYPGAAEMDSETQCLTDADEDGYGASSKDFGCFTVSGSDSYGDGWNGGALIDVLVNGASVGTFTVTSADDSDTVTAEFCAEGTSVEFVYTEGSFTSENTYSISDAAGNVLVEGSPAAGTLYSDSFSGGTDCDDGDAGVGTGDSDGDGYDACNTENPNDCDDTDAAINPSVDGDADGFSICDECDDANADIHPDAEEVYYDGVDQNCDGMSDYDWDMDGYDAMEYDDGTGTMVAHGGDDCDDADEDLHPADMEADPAQCYMDADADGYGDADLSEGEMDAGIVAGTDCYDSSYGGADTYPGAGFNETGDLATACVEDEDMDGYGDMSPSTYYDITAGTDCDDGDELVSPAVDGDSDGINTCVDCDDTDATNTAEQFEAFEDIDGDGYGSTSTWTCSLDEDGDGTDDLILVGGDCWDSSYSADSVHAYPGAAENETETNDDGELLSELCLLDADEDGYGDAGSYYSDEDGTDCDDDDAAAGVGVWAYDDADEDGYGDDDTFDYVCSLDLDGDGKNDMVEMGGDCDDTPATVDGDEVITDYGGSMTFPGAAEMDSADECLTDNDDDGYAADNTVHGLYEQAVVIGDILTFTLSDAYSDSSTGSVDLYVDYVWVASYDSALYSSTPVSYDHTFAVGGTLQVGWTSPSSWNSELSFEITDSAATSLYSSGTGPDDTVPMMGIGTDSDDSDASVQ
jgi:hypothetical protein